MKQDLVLRGTQCGIVQRLEDFRASHDRVGDLIRLQPRRQVFDFRQQLRALLQRDIRCDCERNPHARVVSLPHRVIQQTDVTAY